MGHFLSAPKVLSTVEACTWAEVKRLGGSPLEFERLRSFPGFIFDTTMAGSHEVFLSFWRGLVHWLTRYRKEITNEDARIILMWASHQFTESRRRRGRVFSWKGRTPARVLQASREYQAAQNQPWSHYTWMPKGWEWTYVDDLERIWTFTELCSGKELYEEGKALHHCVGGYAYGCAEGDSAIFSLKCDGKRRVTVEWGMERWEVLQAHGNCNRQMDKVERWIVGEWIRKVIPPQK